MSVCNTDIILQMTILDNEISFLQFLLLQFFLISEHHIFSIFIQSYKKKNISNAICFKTVF